ncbi:MAG: glycosyltransferase family 2 protein [Nocardioidaceae bacterium]
MSVRTDQGVSVVIATRSRPQLLAKAVEACLSQEHAGPIEVVAVFDQSEPRSELCRDDADRQVRVTSNHRTPGLPGARNTGILAATHDLVAFCDDDDLWLPGKLGRQVAAIRESGTRAAVTGIQVRYGERLRLRPLAPAPLRLADLVRDRVTSAHPSTYLADRGFLIENDLLVDEKIPGGYAEDYDWLLRVAAHTDVAVVPEPMVEVLWHPGSFFTNRWTTIVEALDYLVDKHPYIRDDRAGLARIRGQQAFALAGLGRRRESWRKLTETARHNPRERRILATLPVLAGVVSGERVMRTANHFGRGI